MIMIIIFSHIKYSCCNSFLSLFWSPLHLVWLLFFLPKSSPILKNCLFWIRILLCHVTKKYSVYYLLTSMVKLFGEVTTKHFSHKWHFLCPIVASLCVSITFSHEVDLKQIIFRYFLNSFALLFQINGHKEDILSLSQCPPNLLATSSYDGEIIVWNMVSGHIFCHLHAPAPEGYKDQSCRCITDGTEDRIDVGRYWSAATDRVSMSKQRQSNNCFAL